MRVFGLTGGIGSGKTEVGRVFAMLGIPVIDADRVARVQASSGNVAFGRIVGEFGTGILGADGEIDREALAALVFGDPGRLAVLNRITHGLVLEEVRRRLTVLGALGVRCAVVEAALLVETGADADMNGLVVVRAPPGERVRRVVARDGVGEADVMKRMDAQMPEGEKAATARWIIDNDAGLEDLRRAAVQTAVEMTEEGTR